MDWKFSFILILTLLSATTGWQMALFFPPEQYQIAGWVMTGVGTLVCLVAAAR